MAKLFYTLQEAAQKLRKSTDEVMSMAKAGQLQELRDKDQVLFRRSAIDQIAGDTDGGDINLDGLDLSNSGSSIQLDGSSAGGNADLRLDDDLRLEDDLRLDDEPLAPATPIAASGADDSMALDELTLADDEPASTPPPAPAPRAVATPSPAASSGGSRGGSGTGLGLVDSSAGSMAMAAGGMDDSMALNPGQTQLEAVGSGSGLLDISSEESFFGAQMIEESMGGDEAAVMPDAGGADIFGGGEAATTEEVAPVTAGTAGVAFGQTKVAEAFDAKFSGFTGGAMIVAALCLVAGGWAVAEMAVGNYTDIAKMIAENWMYVLGGGVGAVLGCGGIGLGIGKATA